jgi:hypothetical protein
MGVFLENGLWGKDSVNRPLSDLWTLAPEKRETASCATLTKFIPKEKAGPVVLENDV